MLVQSILITVVLLQGCLAASRADCKTEEGSDCVFPFRYRGILYNKCTKVEDTKLWCSTQTMYNDHHIAGLGRNSMAIVQKPILKHLMQILAYTNL